MPITAAYGQNPSGHRCARPPPLKGKACFGRTPVKGAPQGGALAELARKAAGAALVFARRGVRAIEEAAGRWRSVDWGKVEQETVREAVAEHGRSMSETVGALLDHSPGHAGTSREQAADILAEVARREASQPQRQRQRPESTRDYGPAPR